MQSKKMGRNPETREPPNRNSTDRRGRRKSTKITDKPIKRQKCVSHALSTACQFQRKNLPKKKPPTSKQNLPNLAERGEKQTLTTDKPQSQQRGRRWQANKPIDIHSPSNLRQIRNATPSGEMKAIQAKSKSGFIDPMTMAKHSKSQRKTSSTKMPADRQRRMVGKISTSCRRKLFEPMNQKPEDNEFTNSALRS